MANIIGGAQAYRDSFDPIAYLSNYINVRQLEATTPIYDFKLRKANEAVQDFLLKGKIKGDRLLVVGSGPSVYELAYLVPHYSNIVLSDVADRNLAEIRKWVDCDLSCYNFSPFFKHFATRSGIRWETNEDLARKSVKDIVICDMYEEDPLAPNKFDTFDAIVAPQCLSALRPLQNARKAVKNLTTRYLKPGGYFITVGVFGDEPFYAVGKETFDWAQYSVDDFKKMQEDAGLEIKCVYPFVERDPGLQESAVANFNLVTVIAQRQ